MGVVKAACRNKKLAFRIYTHPTNSTRNSRHGRPASASGRERRRPRRVFPRRRAPRPMPPFEEAPFVRSEGDRAFLAGTHATNEEPPPDVASRFPSCLRGGVAAVPFWRVGTPYMTSDVVHAQVDEACYSKTGYCSSGFQAGRAFRAPLLIRPAGAGWLTDHVSELDSPMLLL